MAFLRTQKPEKLSLYSSCYGFIELSPSLKSTFMNLVSSLVEEDNGSKARGGEEAEAIFKHCMKWLDEKELTSVLYVAFGSQSSV
ncbi:Hypothetical predicted protein [Olea europaea subsp. europaea]|uniref:Uncharacterized protein n=1 Tax=Olea europaea subsp. europaea TaxID=158383 RepID=A0A8S0RFS7_OLEEU|nr:Hypothetical predicted protein [Olea europaea subsp. europaea]